jgi:D-serine deaminase-like pyridoxal phosphate-dependent protein
MEKKRHHILKGKMSKWDLDTPALLLDMDVFEANLTKLSEYCRENKTAFRPHSKAHKCPIISKRQISSGAVGICTAKTSEAEVMADSGIKNILITSPVITPYKIKRLMDIRKNTSGLMVVVDTVKNVSDLSEAAKRDNLKLDVLVDNNIGDDRTGVKPGKPAVDLTKKILKSDGLRFRGIQAYAGFIQQIHGFHERRKRNMECMEKALESIHLIEKEGIHVEIFTGGGTGTYNINHNVPGFTDVQPGSYVFMDAEYLAIGGKDSPENLFDDFKPSLTVLATAISQPLKGKITVDAGMKAFATDGPNPVLKGITGISYEFMGDEHGGLTFENPSCEIKIGDKVEFIVSHCDPTVNLYDNYYCIRNGILEDIWEVSGRGMSQ